MIKTIAKLIKNILYRLGIEISFVRKAKHISSIEFNAIEEVEKSWGDEKIVKAFLSKGNSEFFKTILKKITDNSIDLNNKVIADVGCGTGLLLKFIKDNSINSKFSGLEFSENALIIVKRVIPEATTFKHDIYNSLPKHFDIILCTEVLEHLLYPEKAFVNLMDGLNSGGSMVITVPNGRIDNFEGHINFWSPESWNVFIENNAQRNYFKTDKLNERNLIAIIKKQ